MLSLCSVFSASPLRVFFLFRLALVFSGVAPALLGQTTGEIAALGLTATVQASPASITLSWAAAPVGITPTSTSVYRRVDGAYGNYISTDSWTLRTTLGANALSYIDTEAAIGARYEYLVIRQHNTSNLPSRSRGYIAASIQAPLLDSRGTLLLVVDGTLAPALATELDSLEMDLIGDGWRVERLLAPRAETFDSAKVETVKTAIGQRRSALASDADPANDLSAIYLLGRVPVPYSGTSAADGHTDHSGAWPADSYYADFSHASWPDTATNTLSERTENHNRPGDGKHDVTIYRTHLDGIQDVTWELSFGIGRVDLHNMPVFGDEVDLLRRYLAKARAWRHGQLTAPRRAIYKDDFGLGYSAGILNNLRALFGSSQVTSDTNLLTTLRSQPYTWAAGLGGGTYQSANNIGTTFDFVAAPRQAVFFNLFGSYFADWDNQNNFLRAPLAMRDWGLACDWGNDLSGLDAALHRWAMGYGLHIGETHRRAARWINPQIANLMGDPALRLHVVIPPSRLQAIRSGHVALTWSASADAGLGYHVYRSATRKGAYTRLTSTPVADTAYTDAAPPAGDLWYMVRAVKLESTNGGTYDNASQGIFAPAAAAAPAAPTGFAASAAGSTLADLSWIAPGGDAPPSIVVSRATASGGPFTEIALTAPGDVSYRDTGLSPGATVFYRIAARNASGTSTPTATLAVTPAALAPAPPLGLTVHARQSDQVDLSWSRLAANTTATLLQIQRSHGAAGPWSTLALLANETTEWRDSGTVGEIIYFYRVVAVSADGSSPSTAVSVTTPRALPLGLRAADIGGPLWPEGLAVFDGTTLMLQSAGFLTDGNNDRLLFASARFGGDTDFVTRVAPASTGGSHNDGGILVRASRSPDAPMIFVAANRRTDAQSLRVRWRESTGASVGPSRTVAVGPVARPVWLKLSRRGDAFTAYHSQNGADWTFITTQTLPNLGAESEWGVFYTHGSSSGGSSATTFTDTQLTPPPPDSLPAAPEKLRAIGANSSTVHLAWQDLSGNESGFEIERAASASGPWWFAGTSPAGVPRFDDTAVALGETWFYRVRAVNALGASGYGALASASPVSGVRFHHDGQGDAQALYLFNGDNGVFTPVSGEGAAGDIALVHSSGSTRPNAVLQQALAGGASRTLSVLLRWRANTVTGGQLFYLGLGPRADYYPMVSGATTFGTATDYALFLALQKSNNTSQTNRPRLNLTNFFDGGNNIATSAYLASDLADGDWLRLTLAITPTGNTYALEGTLESLGAEAKSTPALLLTVSAAGWTNAQLAADSSAYVYFGGQNASARGIAAVDDLFVGGLDRRPDAPSALALAARTDSSLSFFWASQSGAQESGFAIERASQPSGPFARVAVTTSSPTYVTDTGLTGPTTYYYRVVALDPRYGQSAPSPVAAFATLDPWQGALFTHDETGRTADLLYTATGANGAFAAAAVGLGGSLGLLPADSSNHQASALVHAVDGGQSRELHLHFRWRTAVWDGGVPLYLGLGPSSTYVPLVSGSGSASNYGIHVGLDKASAPGLQRVRLRLSNFFDGGNNQLLSDYLGSDLSDGHWYRLRLRLTRSAGSTYDLVGILESRGASGTAEPVELLRLTNNGWTNAQLATDANAHPYLGGQSAFRRGIAAVDDLFVGGLTLPPASTPYELWQANTFSTEQLADPALEATVWGSLSDPDGDGLVNLLEYALQLDPISASAGPAVSLTTSEPSSLQISFRRARAELDYIVEASNDLASWLPVAANPGSVGDMVTVTDTVPLGAAPRRYIRLRVTAP